jgi:hypothetical protein
MLRKLTPALIGAVIASIVVVGVLRPDVFRYMGYSERARISAIVMQFLALKAAADASLTNQMRIENPQPIYDEWEKMGGGGRKNDATDLVVGKNAQVVIISVPLGKVFAFQPQPGDKSWHCTMFPPVTYKNICDRLFPISTP